MRSHARVVIVGGGIMGAGMAYYLTEMGWTDTLLVEKGELTSGSTWHAAGQCPSFIGNYTMAKIHHTTNTLYPKLESITGQPTGWHGCGGIRLATTPSEVDWFHHVAGFAPNVGFELEVIPPDRIKQINPWLQTDGILAGAYTTLDGYVDPASACNALAAGARQNGATIVRRNRVLDIQPLPSGEFTVVTEQGNITCEHVINAAGCYAREVAAMVGVTVPIANMQHQYVVTEPLDEFLNSDKEIPVMRDPETAGYYRQEQKSGLIGIYEQHGAKIAWEQNGGSPAWESSHELFDSDLDRIAPWLELAIERMPIFTHAGIRRVINGAIPHTPDGNPLLGPVEGLPNFWQCCGVSIGIAQSPGCSKYLAQWIIEGDSEVNTAPIDSRRFGGYADQTYAKIKGIADYEEMFVTPLPGREIEAARNNRTTSLHDRLLEKGAVYTEAFGWERPKYFAPKGFVEQCQHRRSNIFPLVAQECQGVREAVGLMDFSSFAKFEVSGSGATAYLDYLTANRLPKKIGAIRLSHVLSPQGRIEGEWTIARLDEERYYIVTGAAAERLALTTLMSAANDQIKIDNVTDDLGILVVAGPRSREVLQPLTSTDLSSANFPWLSSQSITLADVRLRAMRLNYVGELGWELHAPIADLAKLYARIWSAGEPFGVVDFGSHAVNSMRLEKAYHGAGTELTNEINMFEAGCRRFFAGDKGDFRGREATLSAQCLSTLAIYGEVAADDCDLYGGEPVLLGDKTVGVCTSGGYGFATQKSLGFAFVDPEVAESSELEVVILGQRRSFTPLAEPAWDPTNQRQKA